MDFEGADETDLRELSKSALSEISELFEEQTTFLKQLVTEKAECLALSEKCRELAQSASSSQSASSPQSAVSAAELKRLKDQLTENETRVKALEEKLESAEKSSQYYCSLCDDLEFCLEHRDKMIKDLETQLRNKLEQANAEKENLEKRVDELGKRSRQLLNENVKLSLEKNSMHDDLLRKIASLESDLAAANDSKVEAQKTAIQAKEDCQNQLQLMKEVQEKYQRELMLHEDDVKQAQEKYQRELMLHEEDIQQHQACRKKLDEIKLKLRDTEQELVECKMSCKERERVLLDECRTLTESNVDLKKQNQSLLDALELCATKNDYMVNDSIEKSEEMFALKEKLVLAEIRAEYYYTMCDGFECRLKQDEMNKDLETQLRNKLEQTNAEMENLEKCVDELEKRNRQLLEKNKVSQNESNKCEQRSWDEDFLEVIEDDVEDATNPEETEGTTTCSCATEDDYMVNDSIEKSEEMFDEVEANVAAVPASEQALTYASTVPSIKIDGSERTRSDILESLEQAKQSKLAFQPTEADSSLSQVLPRSKGNEPQSVINSIASSDESRSYVKIVMDSQHAEDFAEFLTYILPDVMFTVCFHSKSVWVLKFQSPGDADSATNALNYQRFAGNQGRRVSAVVCSYTEVAFYLHHSSAGEKK